MNNPCRRASSCRTISSAAYLLRASILRAALAWAAVQPAYAQELPSTIDDLSALRSEHGQPKSDITLSGNAAFLTQYAKRGFTLSAERPAVQVEFDLFYKEIYYAGIWASNANFGSGSQRPGPRQRRD